MRKWSRYLAGVVAITGWLALLAPAGAETCKLESKQIDRTNLSGSSRTNFDYWFQATRSQSFFMQIGGPAGMVRGSQQEGVPEFSKVIKKEPTEYNSQHPLRGVAKLGSQYFGFVLDAAEKDDADKKEDQKKEDVKDDGASKKEQEDATSNAKKAAEAAKLMKSVAYGRLYFDVNHNGDLTDDPVIESKTARNQSINYISATFPNVDLKIDVDGKEIDYAFSMNVYSYATTQYSYANASLNAAAYREGEMEIDGKKYRVVVVDYNSNGRYDDQAGINESVKLSDGTVYPTIGDMLYLIDPNAKPGRYANPYDATSNDAMFYVAKQVQLGGRFLDLKVSPAGDELSLTPSTTPVGFVMNPNQGYRAIVYGEQGFLKVVGDESGKAPLPVGDWRLASYTIDKTGLAEPEKDVQQDGSLLDTLKRVIGGSTSSPRGVTMVSAGQT